MDLQYKTLECELKSEGDDGAFELYALAFNNEDRQGDIIAPGAVKNLEELTRDGWGALSHRAMDLPVAYAESATQDARGLLIRGKFHSHPQAQACRTVVRERMAAGKSVKCSIGYAIDDAAQETRNGRPVRVLKAIRVYEFSFVNLPANPEAGVVSAKSAEEANAMPDLEDKTGLLDALKELLGLSKKAIDKGKMSKSGMTRLKAFAEAMHEHGEMTREHADTMREHAKCAKDMAKEMKSFLKAYDPDEDGDDDAFEEGDEDNDREELPPRKKPKKKDEKPEDTSDGDPPKGMTRESLAQKLAALRGY